MYTTGGYSTRPLTCLKASDLAVDALPALETHPAHLTDDEKEEVRENDANEPEEMNETREIAVPMHVSYSCLVEFELCYRLKHAC